MESPIQFIKLGQCPNCHNDTLVLLYWEKVISDINKEGKLVESVVDNFDVKILCRTCKKEYNVNKQGNYYAPVNNEIERIRDFIVEINKNQNIKNPFYAEV